MYICIYLITSGIPHKNKTMKNLISLEVLFVLCLLLVDRMGHIC
ncbi:hypothetical protein CCP3SC1AL1_1830005 [Gammaproteobacteria bacterium]